MFLNVVSSQAGIGIFNFLHNFSIFSTICCFYPLHILIDFCDKMEFEKQNSSQNKNQSLKVNTLDMEIGKL